MKFEYKSELSGENLIGMDFFSGNYVLDWKTGNPCVNLDQLERPQFCVLAANGYGIRQAERFTDVPSRNQTSILSLLFWPKTKRCSYYTGGDGYPTVARNAIVPFLNNMSVTALKLDHHGSSGELLGVASDRVTEDIVSMMRPQKILVTPGDGYGHPSWDVIAFLYDHYRSGKLNPEARLYTTRSPYWVQDARLSGMDLNLGKIRKIWKILQKWEEKPTEDIVTSWDAWKADFQMADLDEPDDLTDEPYQPDSDIVNAAIDALLFDQIGKEAEDALFEKFAKDFVELAKRNPDEAFKALRTKPTKIEMKMFNQQQWRELFGRWKWANIKAYQKALGVALAQKLDVLELAPDKSSPVAQGIEALITRQEERTAWADTMRLLWNHLSPQAVNPDPDQSQWYLVRLTSKNSNTEYGAIRTYTPEGGEPDVFQTTLRGADTRLYTEEMNWTKKDFAAQKLSEEDRRQVEKFSLLRSKERGFEREIVNMRKSLGIDRPKVIKIIKADNKTIKVTKQKILKAKANLLELRKNMYMK